MQPKYKVEMKQSAYQDNYHVGHLEPKVDIQAEISHFDSDYGVYRLAELITLRKNPFNCGIAELGGIQLHWDGENKELKDFHDEVIQSLLKIAEGWKKGLVRATTADVGSYKGDILKRNGFVMTGTFQNPNTGNIIYEWSRYKDGVQRELPKV